ncbi:SGNH/GDSL hydrolase family protein [Melioribacteraceae bacterium 4301-Me]|uniref:SGNH/GDSL hydrolase family protein n=1 Tax=Pyranulibacter aquaticus TaxID=3163344 RepID=UPI0035992515
MRIDIKLIWLIILTISLISCDINEETKNNSKILDQLIVFGDSNSDPGNIYNKTNHLIPVTPPYFQGRFCNGPTWAELVASKFNLVGDANMNFAYGGACSDSLNAIALKIPPQAPEPYSTIRNAIMFTGLLEQVEELRASAIRPKLNHLVVIFIGGNDYSLENEVNDSKVDHVISSIEKAISRIKEMGWKRIVIFTLNDHAATIELDSSAVEADKVYFELAKRNNARLKEAVVQWSNKLGIDIKIWDFAAFLKDVTDHAVSYGFTDLLNPIYEGSFFAFDGKLNDAKGKLFWDFTPHYSAAIHNVISDEFIKFLQNFN